MNSRPEHWYLQKDDGSEYGPVTLDRLQQWAAESRLVPGNRVSCDRDEWIPVEDLQSLEMDWMARRHDGCEYGPFNIRAVPDLFRHGVLPAEAKLRNERTQETVGVDQVLARLGTAGVKHPRPLSGSGTDEPCSTLEINTPAMREVPAEPVSATLDESPPAAHADSSKQDIEAGEGPIRERIAELETECEALRVAREEIADRLVRERADREREREAREAEVSRMETGLQATIDDLHTGQVRYREELETLRHTLENEVRQVAFMKKNNASLLHEMEGQARRAHRLMRAFAVAVLVSIILLAGWMLCLTSSRHMEPQAGYIIQDAPLSPRHAEAPGTPDSPSPVRPSPAPSPSPRPTPLAIVDWPAIRIEGVEVRRSGRRLSLVFAEPVFSRLAVLSDWGRSALQALAAEISPHMDRFSITVEGHTDNIPVSASSAFESNVQLGRARADTAVAFLVGTCGLPERALTAVSSGDRNPPYPNDTAINRRRNRTVILHIEPVIPDEDQVAPAPRPVL